MKLKLSIYLICLTAVLATCKTEYLEINNPGLFIYASDEYMELVSLNNHGLLLDKKKVVFFYNNNSISYKSSESHIQNQLSFGLNNYTISLKKGFANQSTEKITEILALKNGNYIARMVDFSRDSIIGNVRFQKEYIVLLDINGNKIKEYFINNTSNLYASQILSLSNGTYLVVVNNFENKYNLLGKKDFLCFDESLNLLWKKTYGSNKYASASQVIITNNSIFLIQNPPFQSADYSLVSINLAGDSIPNGSYLGNMQVPLHKAIDFLPYGKGFQFLGIDYDLANGDRFIRVVFDELGRKTSVNYIDYHQFMKNSQEVDFGNLLKSMSNIVVKDHKYYFTMTVYEKAGNKDNLINKFVRVNEEFEIEAINTIETGKLSTGSFKYLVPVEDYFLSVSTCLLNGKYVLRFIKTDKVGKIIQ